MKKNIKTLSQLAEYINSKEDYPLDVEDICQAHGWEICKADWDIAIDREKNEKLSFTGEGDKVGVFSYRGGAREGAGRNSLFKNESKKKITLSLTESSISRLNEAAKEEGLSRSDILNRIILANIPDNVDYEEELKNLGFTTNVDITDTLTKFTAKKGDRTIETDYSETYCQASEEDVCNKAWLKIYQIALI